MTYDNPLDNYYGNTTYRYWPRFVIPRKTQDQETSLYMSYLKNSGP